MPIASQVVIPSFLELRIQKKTEGMSQQGRGGWGVKIPSQLFFCKKKKNLHNLRVQFSTHKRSKCVCVEERRFFLSDVQAFNFFSEKESNAITSRTNFNFEIRLNFERAVPEPMLGKR